MKISYNKYNLPNGLTVILQPMPFVNSVVVNVVVGAGPRFETKKSAGLAHFLEHMLFEGTKRFPTAKDVARRIEKIGGTSRAFTEKEYVSYYTKIPKQHLNVAFDYLSDILFNSLLESDVIEKEKRIVIEELRRSEDNPEVNIWNLWLEWIWGKNQSLGRSTMGDEVTIKKITKQKLQDYLDMLYHPSNMAIVVTGNFSIKEAKEYILKYFGKTRSKSVPLFKRVRFNHKKIHTKIVQSDTKQAQLILGFVTDISYHHKDRFSIRAIADVLSGGISSRLSNKLIYELGIAYSAWAYTWIFSDNGLFCISGGFSPRNLKNAIKVILEELNKLKKRKVAETELKEAKEKNIAELFFSLETPDAMASLYSSQQITEKQIMTPEKISTKIDKVTTEDMLRVARKYFNLENLRLIIHGPLKEKEIISIEKLLKQMS